MLKTTSLVSVVAAQDLLARAQGATQAWKFKDAEGAFLLEPEGNFRSNDAEDQVRPRWRGVASAMAVGPRRRRRGRRHRRSTSRMLRAAPSPIHVISAVGR